MASPVRISQHGEPHALIIGWLMVYKAYTPGVQLGGRELLLYSTSLVEISAN